jgi:putative salt-induced outer membrane protein
MKQLRPLLLMATIVGLVSPNARAQVTNNPSTNGIKWEGSAAAGATLTRGNSHTFLATASIVDTGKWDKNELQLGADGAYGKTEINNVNNETAETLHGFVQYNRLFTDRFYGYGRVDGLHDGIADIDYRVALSPGAGYYVIKTDKQDLSGEVGPGFIYEKLGGKTDDYFTLRIAEKYNLKISDRARLWETLEFLPQVDKFDNYIVNFEIGIETDLSATKKFSLRTFLDDTYNSKPAEGRLKNDLKLVSAIAYKF